MSHTAYIRCRLLDLLYRTIPESVAVNLLLAGILVYFYHSFDSPLLIALLYGALIAVAFYRLIIYQVHKKNRCDFKNFNHFSKLQFVGVAMTGLVWGAGILLLYPDHNLVYQLFLTFVIAGLTAGSITTLSIDRRSALFFLSITLIPIDILLLTTDSHLAKAMGVMGSAYYTFLVVNALKVGRLFWHEFSLEEENLKTSAALSRNQKKMQLIFDQVPLGLFIYDKDMVLQDINATLCRHLKIDKKQIIGMKLNQIKDRRILKTLEAPFTKHSNGFYKGEYISMLTNTKRYIRLETFPVLDENGEIVAAMGIVENISGKHQTRKSLKEFALFFIKNPNPILMIRAEDGKIELENPASRKLRKELDLDEKTSWNRMLNKIARTKLSTAIFKLNKRIYRFDNQQIDDNHIRLYGRDITEEDRSRRLADFLAYHDELTKLPKRNRLFEKIDEAGYRAGRTGMYQALMYLDLDNFKQINDVMGHNIGDRLLVDVAKRLHSVLRKSDMLTRLGGDEFVILASDLAMREDEAMARSEVIATKLKEVLSAPFQIEQHTVYTTISIGITLFNEEKNAYDLLKEADSAMYRAKHQGKNSISFFDESLAKKIARKAKILEYLHRAIENKELYLVYQPQVRINDGQVEAAEALLRWYNPILGEVSPAEFIPVAEEGGLIHELDAWVIEQICHDLSTLQSLSYIAANVSVKEFQRPDYVNSLLSRLSQKEISKIELEITESLLLEDTDTVIKKLQTLKKAGFKLSIDDFGTGYSSLAYIKRMPIDTLKIDRSFVRDIGIDPSSEKIAEVIVDMARHFDLKTVVEGVEEIRQFAFFKRIGADLIQGYYFAKPMRLEKFKVWLEGKNR